MNDMEARARELFERSVQELDETAVKRLRLARRATLAAGEKTPRWQGWGAGLATASVLALGLAWWWPREAAPPQAPLAPVAMHAPAAVADAEEPVLAEADENADLYAWLAEAPVATEPEEHRL